LGRRDRLLGEKTLKQQIKAPDGNSVRRFSLSKKSACGGLFRQKLKKCLRPGAQTPRPPGTGGKRQPCGLLREAQSDPKVRRKEAPALWAVATEGGKAT